MREIKGKLLKNKVLKNKSTNDMLRRKNGIITNIGDINQTVSIIILNVMNGNCQESHLCQEN